MTTSDQSRTPELPEPVGYRYRVCDPSFQGESWIGWVAQGAELDVRPPKDDSPPSWRKEMGDG